MMLPKLSLPFWAATTGAVVMVGCRVLSRNPTAGLISQCKSSFFVTSYKF
jgi:hypothetical protein